MVDIKYRVLESRNTDGIYCASFGVAYSVRTNGIFLHVQPSFRDRYIQKNNLEDLTDGDIPSNILDSIPNIVLSWSSHIHEWIGREFNLVLAMAQHDGFMREKSEQAN